MTFGGTSEIPAIPAGFFYSGSPAFEGTIQLRGIPIDPESSSADTVVERLQDAQFAGIPAEDTVPIELLQLSLASARPIEVGGRWYHATVSLNPAEPSTGTMTISLTSATGGTFTSSITVNPRFEFTPAEGGEPLILSTGFGRGLDLHTVTPQTWSTTPPEGDQPTCPPPCVPGTGFYTTSEPSEGHGVFEFATGRHDVALATGVGTSDDRDGDGVIDSQDNCPHDHNPCQQDANKNAVGDACEHNEPGTKHDPYVCPGACGQCGEGGGDFSIDPVYLFSGEFYLSQVDLRIPGRGFDFVWARKYRSRIGPHTAMGNGWDFSYNIYIDCTTPNPILHDGNTRADTYLPIGPGVWFRPEFFRELSRATDGGYTLLFADRGTWNFHACDGSARQGKLSSIQDRNGNGMQFDHDSQGRLTTIHDTLDTGGHNRDITISYRTLMCGSQPRDLIAAVTDYTGRSWTYEHYDGTEPGGNCGDLKSVTTPGVTEFPAGKTTEYTYTTGSADARLNHNLLTVTDPRHQTYLLNEYAPTTDPLELKFDRLVRQTWGEPGDIVDLVYEQVQPTADNNNAVIKVIVNDRVGNVREYFYDGGDEGRNRGVMQREYTGRADPDSPTSATANRPTGKLRPDDPDYFETRFAYNGDSLVTEVTHPNKNYETSAYDTSTNRRANGNLKMRCRYPCPLGQPTCPHANSTQPNGICESFVFDVDFGCAGCASNFVTEHTDGRGNATFHDYDDHGNRIHTTHRDGGEEDFEYNSFGQMTAHVWPDNDGHRRRDEFVYYDMANDPTPEKRQVGYLRHEIIDAPNLALTTTIEYDALGRIIRHVDRRGHVSSSEYNALNQVVRKLSREVALPAVAAAANDEASDSTSAPTSVHYDTLYHYDANDNLVRTDVENRDDRGVLQPNTHFTTVVEYDILNHPIQECQEVGNYSGPIPGTAQLPLCVGLPGSDFITTEHEYDANRNRTVTRFGEAVEGRQVHNATRTLYDERDLLFKETLAPGDVAQSTTQYDYDGNRNLRFTRQGIEDVGGVRITQNFYDGYDRLLESRDPMANRMRYAYDANHNRLEEIIQGDRVDLPGSQEDIVLYKATHDFDPMDRVTRTRVAFFNLAPDGSMIPLPGGYEPGSSWTQTTFSNNSQVLSVTDDSGDTITTQYDSANRRNRGTDPLGNTVTFEYDGNSNVTRVTEVEKSDIGSPEQTFVTRYQHDGVDRLIETTDSSGNVTRFGYDSRNNQLVMTDALGNETRQVYDGLNRQIKTVRDMNGKGANVYANPGDGDPDIVTAQSWDDSSRLTSQTDDNGNATRYAYDPLNRMDAEVFADGTRRSFEYDVHHNRVRSEDANGSVAANQYDLLNRLIRRDITPGPQVSHDITLETYQYDGLSRLVRAEDDDSLVTRGYNSLSLVMEETLTINPGQFDESSGTTTSEYDGDGNRTRCTYPGGRVIGCTFDELDRKKRIEDLAGVPRGGTPQLVAEYFYVGPGRVERRTYGNNTQLDIDYDGIDGIPNPANDFGVKRIVRTRHTVSNVSCSADAFCPPGTTCDDVGICVIDDRTYTWDRVFNKTKREDIRPMEDTAPRTPRLRHDYRYDDTVYRLSRTLVTDRAADGAPTLVRDTTYQHDGVQNRVRVLGNPDEGEHVGDYLMSDLGPEPADQAMNQYTLTPGGPQGYDQNGNLVRIGIPDVNGDGLVDLTEYASLSDCLCCPESGPAPCPPAGCDCPTDCRCDLGACSSPASCPQFDFNGDQRTDLRDIQQFQLAFSRSGEILYDYRNMMVEYRDLTAGQRHTYAYDALGRRIQKTVNTDDVASNSAFSIQHSAIAASPRAVTRFFYNDSWQVLEEQDATGETTSTYVYGLYIDEVLSMFQHPPGGAPPSLFYHHSDDLYNVMVVTNSLGWPVRRIEYGDYGTPHVTDGQGKATSGSVSPYFFTGRRLDPESTWYHYRTRYAHSGAFTSRDTIGSWSDRANLGNGFSYVGANPTTYYDPLGRGADELPCPQGCTLSRKPEFKPSDAGTERIRVKAGYSWSPHDFYRWTELQWRWIKQGAGVYGNCNESVAGQICWFTGSYKEWKLTASYKVPELGTNPWLTVISGFSLEAVFKQTDTSGALSCKRYSVAADPQYYFVVFPAVLLASEYSRTTPVRDGSDCPYCPLRSNTKLTELVHAIDYYVCKCLCKDCNGE